MSDKPKHESRVHQFSNAMTSWLRENPTLALVTQFLVPFVLVCWNFWLSCTQVRRDEVQDLRDELRARKEGLYDIAQLDISINSDATCRITNLGAKSIENFEVQWRVYPMDAARCEFGIGVTFHKDETVQEVLASRGRVESVFEHVSYNNAITNRENQRPFSHGCPLDHDCPIFVECAFSYFDTFGNFQEKTDYALLNEKEYGLIPIKTLGVLVGDRFDWPNNSPNEARWNCFIENRKRVRDPWKEIAAHNEQFNRALQHERKDRDK